MGGGHGLETVHRYDKRQRPQRHLGASPSGCGCFVPHHGHMDDREDVGGLPGDAWEWMGIEKPPWLRPDHPVAQIAILVLVQAAMAFVAYVVFCIGAFAVAPLFQGYTGDAGVEAWLFFGGSLLVGAVIFALYPFYRWQVTGNWWFLLIASLGIPLALFFLWLVVTP